MAELEKLCCTDSKVETLKKINAIIDNKANTDLSNLSEAGQAILDTKTNINLSNLSATGEAKLNNLVKNKANTDLSNLTTSGQAKFDAKADKSELTSKANTDLSNLSAQGQAKFDEKVDVDDMVEINLGLTLTLFDTILKDHVLTYEETKGLALQGTYVYKEALAGSRYGYPDFYAKVIEEYNQATTTETVNGVTVKVHSNGHKFYDIANKTAIDEFFNSMGSAWFYGVDTANERIFLPRNNYFEQVTGDASEVGLSVEAGLPDHNHTVSYEGSSVDDGDPGSRLLSTPSGANGTYTLTSTKASTSNSTYGNSNTVQPNAVKKLLYICVGNTTKYEGVTDVVNQGMEILEQVNLGIESRVAKENMSEVPCITETYVNGTSWYRVYSDGWCEQGGKYTGNSSQTISLIKPYKDTNYSILISGVANFTSQSATAFAFDSNYGLSTKTNGFWQAKGYIK